MAWLAALLLATGAVVLIAGNFSDLPPGYAGKQFESASKLVQRQGEWRALRAAAVRDLSIFVPIYLVWGLAAAGMVGAAAPADASGHVRPWWSRLARSRRTALVGSAVVAVLGNVVVLLGRRLCQPDWTTLVGVPLIGALGIFILYRRGRTRPELGLQLPALHRVGPVSNGLFVTAVVMALGSAVLAILLRDHVTVLSVVRLLVATAIFEEVIHRGVVLGLWAGTGVSAPWIVLANMVTFALWHVAGADHKDGFAPMEVIGPGALALPLLWARLRFRSVLAAAALHGAANMTATLLTAGAPPSCTPCCVTPPFGTAPAS